MNKTKKQVNTPDHKLLLEEIFRKIIFNEKKINEKNVLTFNNNDFRFEFEIINGRTTVGYELGNIVYNQLQVFNINDGNLQSVYLMLDSESKANNTIEWINRKVKNPNENKAMLDAALCLYDKLKQVDFVNTGLSSLNTISVEFEFYNQEVIIPVISVYNIIRAEDLMEFDFSRFIGQKPGDYTIRFRTVFSAEDNYTERKELSSYDDCIKQATKEVIWRAQEILDNINPGDEIDKDELEELDRMRNIGN